MRPSLITWFVRSLMRHWDLLSQMVATDLRGRYVGSALGLFWSVIHPLVMIVIYTIVFARVMGTRLQGSGDPYAYGVYLCSGLFPWIAFQEIVTRSTTLFPDNANLVRKVAFPKIILYGFVALSTAVNLGLSLALTPSLGLNGVVLGTTIAYVLAFPFFLRLTLRTLPIRLAELAREAWLPERYAHSHGGSQSPR